MDTYSFGAGGRLVLLTFADRAATFESATGKPVAAIAGRFDALSSDGKIAASARQDGTVYVADVRSGAGTILQTGVATPITDLAFGPTPALLVVHDADNRVHVLRCGVCVADDQLLRRARATLTPTAAFHPKQPQIAVGSVG